MIPSDSQAAAEAVKSQFRPQDAEVRVFTAVDCPEDLPLSFGFADGAGFPGDLPAMRDKARGAAKGGANGARPAVFRNQGHRGHQIGWRKGYLRHKVSFAGWRLTPAGPGQVCRPEPGLP